MLISGRSEIKHETGILIHRWLQRIETPEGVVPVDFLIGCNGSGKSSVLEAVGLIFTRIMQNELPGFIFELKYRMPDGTGIYVKPQKKGFCDASGRRRKLYVELEKNGKNYLFHGADEELAAYLEDIRLGRRE